MRKEVVVLVLLAMALAVAGCQGGKGATSSSSTPFIGGSEGLRVSFVENAPPSEVLDNPNPTDSTNAQVQKFDIILKLENVGEQDIAGNAIKTTIGGIYPADFGKTTTDLQNVIYSDLKNKLDAKVDVSKLKLDGVKKDPDGAKIPGAIEELSFKDLAYLKQLEGNAAFPIQADVCYKYTTKAVGDFCMRADLTRTQGGVCQAKGTKPVFSSGSPVQVSSVEESIGGRSKVILKFKIKTVGSGSFFKPEPLGATSEKGCERGNFAKENYVTVTVTSGITGLTCSGFTGTPPKGDVRLANGEGTVTCIQDNANTADALQKVNLQIEYNHLISASTSLLIKHLPGGFEDNSKTGTTTTTTTTTKECTPKDEDTDNYCGATKTRVCDNGKWSVCVSTGTTPVSSTIPPGPPPQK